VSAADDDRVVARRNRGHSGSALQVVCRSFKLRSSHHTTEIAAVETRKNLTRPAAPVKTSGSQKSFPVHRSFP
jgi:hypothetical protein